MTILITGCSSGFGYLTAKALCAAGYDVIATMREPESRNFRAADELREYTQELPGSIRILELDVTSDKSCEQVGKSIEQLDIVIHNAGIGASGIDEAFTTEQLQQLFDVNLFGVHRVNRALLPKLRAQGSGLVIYVSSIAGRLVMPFVGHYTASKFALEALAQSSSYALANLGIETVIVEPGPFATGTQERILRPEDAARAEEYGSVRDRQDEFTQNFREMLAHPAMPKAQVVADAIVKIVGTPSGERPLRVVVDENPGGVRMINQTASEVQNALLRGMGMEELTELKRVKEHE